MNKRWILLIVVVLALFAVTGALAKGSPDRGGVNVPRLGVTYDGYSDGLGLSAFGSYVNGEECGTTTNDVWGAKHFGFGIAHILHDPDGSTSNLHTVLAYDGRFAHFDTNGLVNEGTWSPGCPGHNPDLPSSTDAVPRLGVDLAPVMAVEISFDGYCDGMSLTVSGDNRDVAYFADGSSCGCVTAPLFGSRYAERTSVQARAHTPYSGILVVADDNGLWRMFDDTGEVNSGSWSWGCPAVAAPDLPSAFEEAIDPKK